MQKLGETMASGCGFTIDELRQAEKTFAAAGAKVSVLIVLPPQIFFPHLNTCSVN
jgi:hypothetical protein